MWNPFKKKPKEEKPKHRYISHLIVNGELEANIEDYTENPQTLITNIVTGLISSEDRPLIRVRGIVSAVNIQESKLQYSDDTWISYSGMLVLDRSFPLRFISFPRYKKEIGDLALEKLILETGKTLPLTMTGILGGPGDGTYSLLTEVVEVGNYISPKPTNVPYSLQE